MRFLFLAALLIGVGLLHAATNRSPAATQSGKFTTAKLLSVQRIDAAAASGDAKAPDGLAFHFLVVRKDPSARLALKETRDFFLGEESYRARTQRELGKTFEPSTRVSDEAKFFAANPSMAAGSEETAGVLVISVEISGANLASEKTARVVLHVGTGKDLDTFSFETAIPPR